MFIHLTDVNPVLKVRVDGPYRVQVLEVVKPTLTNTPFSFKDNWFSLQKILQENIMDVSRSSNTRTKKTKQRHHEWNRREGSARGLTTVKGLRGMS